MSSFRTAGFRAFRSAFQPFKANLRANFSKRWQSSASSTEAAEPAKEKLNPFSWNSPVGPKTVHFWAPIMKWVLVGVSISDFARPAEQLSLQQSAALTATGAIWTRWCLIIKPKNYLLAAVNFFLFLANGYQVGRILNYQSEQKKLPIGEEIKAAAVDIKDSAKNVAHDAKEHVNDMTTKAVHYKPSKSS